MSSIGSVGSNNPLINALKVQGLSSDKIDLVEEDLQAVQQQQQSGAVDAAGVRQAIDKQIADDVASGDLSEEDAAKIGKALDAMEGKTTDDTAAAGKGGAKPAGGGGGAGGGRGGGSTEKTEASRTETVSGGVKTTIITYTDGTNETKTSFVSDPDTKASAGKQDDRTAQDYLAKIEPGSLFDAYA